MDVAGWQHPNGAGIDWAALRRVAPGGAAFAFVKASEGEGFVNDWYARDRAGAAKAKVLVGAYHFAAPDRPVVASATAQARFAVKARGGKVLDGELPMVLDLESNPAGLTREEMAQWSLTWLAEVERLSGRRPILYTYPAFFGEQVSPDPALARYPLWIAHYGLGLRSPSVPAPWTRYTFWQFSSEGEVAGVRTGVDLNVFAGSRADLAALTSASVGDTGDALGSAGQRLLDGLMGPLTPRVRTTPSG